MAKNRTTMGSMALQEKQCRVITIEATQSPQNIKLRVAAYARVSSASDDQLNSFAAQSKKNSERSRRRSSCGSSCCGAESVPPHGADLSGQCPGPKQSHGCPDGQQAPQEIDGKAVGTGTQDGRSRKSRHPTNYVMPCSKRPVISFILSPGLSDARRIGATGRGAAGAAASKSGPSRSGSGGVGVTRYSSGTSRPL